MAKSLFIFYSINILIAFYLLKKHHNRLYRLQLESQDLQEKINILNDGNVYELKAKASLQEKIRRYQGLKNIIEEINQTLSLEAVADNLILIAFSLIGKDKGTCLLYLVDNQTQKLNLFKTRKENKELIIKTKGGDIFDFWVLRHTSPLLVEDIRKDFRFDLDKLSAEGTGRPISSLISSSFVSANNRFLGILRLDSPQASFYTQDDLRFLMTISDIGGVALENGELFQKTQELAIRDELTFLYTRGYFLERLKEECIRSMRHNRPLSLLMLDIDYFKNYNDKFGHTAGDIVLKTLSQSMVEFLRATPPLLVSRFGGEEFCVMLLGMDKDRAVSVAEDIRRTIEKTKISLRRIETNVTVSIGVATISQDVNDENELVLKADKAMYEAKQKGRNRVCCL